MPPSLRLRDLECPPLLPSFLELTDGRPRAGDSIAIVGDVLFYRDKKGQAVLRPAAKYRQENEVDAKGEREEIRKEIRREATKTSEAQ